MRDKLTDSNDRASAAEELFTKAAISRREPEGPKPTGRCLYCETKLDPGWRWCDADCRDDWAMGER